MARRLRTLNTFEQVFTKLGGVYAIAELTGRGRTAVQNWRAWQQFPAPLYDLMMKRLRKRGCRAPAALWGQESNLDIAA
jgi:hypothetical protein